MERTNTKLICRYGKYSIRICGCQRHNPSVKFKRIQPGLVVNFKELESSLLITMNKWREGKKKNNMEKFVVKQLERRRRLDEEKECPERHIVIR